MRMYISFWWQVAGLQYKKHGQILIAQHTHSNMTSEGNYSL